MLSCDTYRLMWVSLTLDVGYLHGCSSKAQLLLLTLDEGYLLTAVLPDLQHGRHCSLDVGLVLPVAASGLRRGVGPPGLRPWLWALGRGVAPPSHRP